MVECTTEEEWNEPTVRYAAVSVNSWSNMRERELADQPTSSPNERTRKQQQKETNNNNKKANPVSLFCCFLSAGCHSYRTARTVTVICLCVLSLCFLAKHRCLWHSLTAGTLPVRDAIPCSDLGCKYPSPHKNSKKFKKSDVPWLTGDNLSFMTNDMLKRNELAWTHN